MYEDYEGYLLFLVQFVHAVKVLITLLQNMYLAVITPETIILMRK